MKVKGVTINNAGLPGGETYWDAVRATPDEPLIEATITMVLSWNEYHVLITGEIGEVCPICNRDEIHKSSTNISMRPMTVIRLSYAP